MAFDNRKTYLCYNNSDLIRDGYIKSRIEKGYIPVDTFDTSRLKNPLKGISYIVTRDENGEITDVREVKKQLPASKIKIEIDFSKVMKNAVIHPISPGSLGFTPIMGLVGNFGLPAMGLGGITSGLTYLTLHLLDAETKINRKITVTKKMIETGIWECEDGYPLSIFGIVFKAEVIDEAHIDGKKVVNGLDFDVTDPLKNPEVIGKYSDGVWQGTRRKRISGATDDNGLFGAVGEAEIKFENVAYDEQPQLFEKIVKDNRKLKFRGDNYDASGGKDYPFKLSGTSGIDATDKQIRLKVVDDENGKALFSEGDSLYITYSVASERHLRQNLFHRGDIAQGNTIGIIGFRGAIKSQVDAWDYQISTWKVPLLPTGLEMKNIDELDDFYIEDSDYKLTLSEYIEARNLEENEQDTSELNDNLEGWRLSESITNGYVKKFWAADYRGILLYNNGSVEILYSVSFIRDREWFIKYLESLDFIIPTGGVDENGNDIYIESDLEKKIEDYINLDEQAGFLFDLTNISNSLLFDREKVPYYRPFANALKDISKYDNDDSSSGIGIILLDLLEILDVDSSVNINDMNIELYDLSHVEFRYVNAQPLKSYSCEDSFDIHSHHYYSESYDANTDAGGMGAWYDRDFIDNEIFEWRPSGGSIESYWKLETPYFCGEYTNKSRVYTEKMFGPSLDNYSWIFVDTDPFVPSNISSDPHSYFDESVVVFDDNNVHYGLCYNKFTESLFDTQNPVSEIDENRSHIREPYDYNNDFLVGQNRMLGDYPSYSHGIPIVDDVTRICREGKGSEFWFSREIYNEASYGLNLNDDIPKANIPFDWFIRSLIVKYELNNFNNLASTERYVSFYFEGTESSISEVKMLRSDPDKDNVAGMTIDFKYYYNGPLQFLGNFWKKIKIKSIEARYTTTNDDRNITTLDIDDYKIKSGQNAVVYDGQGRLLVFYASTDTNNLDVAVSYDNGYKWIIHKNLIRLIEGEAAEMPFVIKDDGSTQIHLFYVLNGVFLMHKIIDADLLVRDDAFVEYTIPDSYDVGDYNQELDDPEKSYWGEYSDKGISLRRSPSFFIAGDAEDPYFIEQIRIKDALDADYEESGENTVRQFPIFEFYGNQSEMKDSFRGDAYTVYIDDEGVFRLFLLSDGKLSIKRNNGYDNWKYDIEEQIIHKDFIDEQLNKGTPEGIQNIQLVRNDFTTGLISTLYFHNGMLFVRHFQSNLLSPIYDSNGNKSNNDMKKHLEIIEGTNHRPIFLVGKIPENIKQTRIREINKGISSTDSELFIYFPYNKEMLEKFDERFEVDVDTQVFAYTTRTGLIRIFYKDGFGNLNGIILDDLSNPTLETMNRLKR